MNVIETPWLNPLTVNEPEDSDREYPLTGATVYEYVPLDSVNEIVLPVDDLVKLLKVADHEVPFARPDSAKVTV